VQFGSYYHTQHRPKEHGLPLLQENYELEHTGVYILENIPPPGGILAANIWGKKYEKGKRNRGKCRRKRKKGERKKEKEERKRKKGERER
jgi:hypothetical protein